MHYKNTVNTSYIILSGLFVYKKSNIDNTKLIKDYLPWQNRIFDGDYSQTFNYLKSNYYNNYLNNIFPEINQPNAQKREELQLLDHYTFADILNNPTLYQGIEMDVNRGKLVNFNIHSADLYLFPHNIGIFTIKIGLQEKFNTIDNISDFSNRIRLLFSKIKFTDGKEISVKEFIENKLLRSINQYSDLDSYNPQLKSYIQIDLQGEMEEEERNQLIYDIGNISPLGSAKGIGGLAPSKSYYDNQISENIISVFHNWSALSLFDTFTRVSNDFPDNFHSWEYDYFNIYIHTLYSKFFLYLTSSKLSDVTIVNSKTAALRDEFIEFINDELHSHVSYKFLPNLIIEKLHYSLGIDIEVEKMETKVLRINEHFQEKREKRLNIAISLIAALSIFSSLYDFSEWGVAVGYPKELMFPYTSISVALAIFIGIYIILRKSSGK